MNIKSTLIALVVVLGFAAPVFGATILFPTGGGTGWGNIQANTLLTGNGTGRLATTSIGTGLTLSGGILSATAGGSGVGTVSTSTTPLIGGLAYWTSAGYPSLLGTVATGTVSSSGGITTTAGRSAVGGALAISCDVATGSVPGCLSAADWTTFNNKSGFAFPWTPQSWGNSTSTTLGFLNGLLSTASSTIGNGTQAGGLTISGGATTTGNAYFESNICIGTDNCSGADLTISSAASFQSPISNATIHVVGANNQSVRAVFDSNNASNAFGTLIQGRRSRGPAASPSAVTGGDVLLQLAGAGYGTSEYVSSNGSKGIIAIKGDATWTNTNSPARIEFFTVPDSSVTNALRFTIGKAGQWGIGGTASQVASDADFGDSGEGFLSQGAGAAPAWVDVWTEAENTTAAYVPGSRQLTVAGTANQLTSSAGAQDLSADRTWTLSLPNHVIFPSSYQATNGSTTNATSTNLYVSGQTRLGALTSALALTDANGLFGEYAGGSCTNQFIRSLNGAGAATCATVSLTADVTGDLPFSNLAQVSANSVLGNITGSTADAASVATSSLFVFPWSVASGGTGLTTFGGTNHILYTTAADTLSSEAAFTYNPTADRITAVNASTTNLTATTLLAVASTSPAFTFSVNDTGSDFYVTSVGKVVGTDATNAWSGRVSPTRSLVLQTGTTTTWTATTSAAYVPSVVASFAGTLRDISCLASTTKAFLGVRPLINSTAAAPQYFVASNTKGVVRFTGSNTFAVGDTISIMVGTTTTDTNATSISCTLRMTENI